MPKQEGQKSKLLALLRIFETQTDENHLLNGPQLVGLLEQQGILCERKSVYSDIDALNALGYDIQLRRGRGGGYFLASRTFDLAELKLLVDARHERDERIPKPRSRRGFSLVGHGHGRACPVAQDLGHADNRAVDGGRRRFRRRFDRHRAPPQEGRKPWLRPTRAKPPKAIKASKARSTRILSIPFKPKSPPKTKTTEPFAV